MRFKVNQGAFILNLAFAIFFLSFSINYFVGGDWKAGIVFIVLCGIFTYCLFIYRITTVELDHDGVTSRFFGRTLLTMRWDEIQEAGVVDTRVFNRKSKKGPAAKYTRHIYLSRTPMTEKERFDMCLKWPPKDKITISFSEQVYEAIRLIYDREILLYNMDDI